MITIRYADLPEGLHAQAERRGRRTVIYLRPGLTPEQRRRGLRRARQSARMGYGPRLPAAGVAQAVVLDAIRETLGNVGAVLRRHPYGVMLLAAGLCAMVACYTLFVTGSIRLVLHSSPLPVSSGVTHSSAGPPNANLAPGPITASTPGPSGQAAHGHPDEHAGRAAPSPRASTGGAAPGPPGTSSPPPAPPPSPAPSPAPAQRPSELCLTVGPVGVCIP
jgi:hypothetical protein